MITPDGVVGKVIRVDRGSAQVLLINDQLSGVGAMLEKSRLQGIVRGTPSGALLLRNIMSDEKVEVGDLVLSSGGDRVFPKGMPIGRVKTISTTNDIFYNIELKPTANLGQLEEVLVITKLDDRSPKFDNAGPVRAADVRADRLPVVPPAPRTDANSIPLPTSFLPPPGAKPAQAKPSVATAGAQPTAKPGSTAVKTASAQGQQTGLENKSKPIIPTTGSQPNSGNTAAATQGSITPSTAGAKPANKAKRPDGLITPLTESTPPVQRSTPAEPDSSASAGASQPNAGVTRQEKPAEGVVKPATKPKPNATDGQPGGDADPAAPKAPKATPQPSSSTPQRGAR